MKNNILFLVLTAFIATGCTTSGSSVGDMAIGSDSAAIKAGRNRKEAQLSRAELEQHRRQRANKRDQVNGAMGTAAGAVGLIGGIAATAGMIKAIF